MDSRKFKRWGLGLTGVGLLFEFLPFAYALPLLLLVGAVLCAIAMACYARSLERSVMWGLLGLWPFVGPFLGLAFLAFAKRREPDASAPKTMSAAQLKWGWLAYLAVLWLLPLQVYLNDGLACAYLPDERFPSLAMVEGSDCGFASFSTLCLAFFAGLAALHGLPKALRGFGLRVAAPWLALRMVIVGVTFVYALSAIQASEVASRIVEARTAEVLAGLQQGMAKGAAETVILKANASLVPPSASGAASDRENVEYRKVREALALAESGQPVSFEQLHFHRALFNANLDSLDRIAAPRAAGSQSLFVRSCCQMMFRWTRYDLFLDYDADNRLKAARYLKSSHEDGEDQSCVVLFELPPGGKAYPYPCPAGGQAGPTKVAARAQ
ncbi:MAG TPA: hypothetical protein VI321_07995 [Burkholderiales bacterium]